MRSGRQALRRDDFEPALHPPMAGVPGRPMAGRIPGSEADRPARTTATPGNCGNKPVQGGTNVGWDRDPNAALAAAHRL
jgi:hypothetical protein